MNYTRGLALNDFLLRFGYNKEKRKALLFNLEEILYRNNYKAFENNIILLCVFGVVSISDVSDHSLALSNVCIFS